MRTMGVSTLLGVKKEGRSRECMSEEGKKEEV